MQATADRSERLRRAARAVTYATAALELARFRCAELTARMRLLKDSGSQEAVDEAWSMLPDLHGAAELRAFAEQAVGEAMLGAVEAWGVDRA